LLSHVGADGALVDAAVASGAQGLVSAGTGPGAPTPGEEAAFDRARQAGVIVCQSSRTGSGRVLRSPSMRARGLAASGALTPVKARILLSLALTWTDDPEVVQAVVDRW